MQVNCPFCQIVGREQPASFIYEDERVAAFLDIHPINEGHVLVIPRRHEERLSGLSEEEAGHLFKIGRRILKAIEDSGLRCEGANLFLSDGTVAGQEVGHTHLHVSPRFKGDGHRMGFSHGKSGPFLPPSRERLDQIADLISSQWTKQETIQGINQCTEQPPPLEEMVQPVIETKRLLLESFKEADLPDILAYASHPEISQYVIWEPHQSIDDSRKFLDFVRSSTCTERRKLFFVFAIRLKETGKVIGSIDLKKVNPHCGQIDYALGYEHWQKGIMTEAAAAIRDWALGNLPELVRFQAFCVAENVGSARVMEKIGMTREGRRRKAIMIKGRPVDLIDYALVKEKE